MTNTFTGARSLRTRKFYHITGNGTPSPDLPPLKPRQLTNRKQNTLLHSQNKIFADSFLYIWILFIFAEVFNNT